MGYKFNILYLSQYFPPEMGAPSARVFETSRYWIKKGVPVTVLTGFPNHPTGIIPPAYRHKWLMKEVIEGVPVVRTMIFPAANKGFGKRILNYLSFMLSAVMVGGRKVGPVDVVIATSPQFLVGIAGYILSRLKGAQFVFEVRDLWPQSIVELGQLNNRVIIRLLEKIELFLYRKARAIITVSDSSRQIIASRGIPARKIFVIKNGVDLSLFTPGKEMRGLRERLGLKGKFVIAYIGTHGLSHALHNVLWCAKRLKGMPEIQFLFVGEGAEKERLMDQVQHMGLTNVIFIDQISKEELPSYYELADVVLVPLRKLPLFKSVIPSKVFEIMAMAKPIIISVCGEARELVVEKARAGIFVEPENVQQLQEAILKLYRDEGLRKQFGRNGRLFVEKYFDRDQLSEKYLKIIQEKL